MEIVDSSGPAHAVFRDIDEFIAQSLCKDTTAGYLEDSLIPVSWQAIRRMARQALQRL
jgi:hypothetical protein